MPLRISHTVASIADAGAGPSYSVTSLCQALAAGGEDVRLHTIEGRRAGGGHGNSALPSTTGIELAAYRQDLRGFPVARALCFSRDLDAALWQEAADTAIFHTHGLWLMPNIYPARAAHAHGKPFVVSPRGMLGPAALNFSRWKKRALWLLLQRRALQSAACIHATSDAERHEIRAMGLTNPVAVVPNGVEMPACALRQKQMPNRTRTVLSLGRIHPKKGLDRLFHAWARIEAAAPNWRLRIVGPSENNHAGELEKLAKRLGLSRVHIEGIISGEAKTAVLQDADLFVLPSHNENFALTVAESLAAGTPVISTKGAPWEGLKTHGCGWWIAHGVEPLVGALEVAIALPDEVRSAMGRKGRAWMARDFSWHHIAADMRDVYSWLTNGGDRPNTVHAD